jgi:hypothetical protein
MLGIFVMIVRMLGNKQDLVIFYFIYWSIILTSGLNLLFTVDDLGTDYNAW